MLFPSKRSSLLFAREMSDQVETIPLDYHPCGDLKKDLIGMIERAETETAAKMDKYGILAWINAMVSLCWYGYMPFAFTPVSSKDFTDKLAVPLLESQMIWLALLEPEENPKIDMAVKTTIAACPSTEKIYHEYLAVD